jgi:hypothetical protein
MTAFTESNRIGDILKREFAPELNREEVTIASGQNLAAGTVLGKITASGEYMLHDNAATGGTAGAEVAAGVLLFDCNASSGATKAVALLRGPAVVALGKLIFKSGISGANKTAALDKLASLGIVARTTV